MTSILVLWIVYRRAVQVVDNTVKVTDFQSFAILRKAAKLKFTIYAGHEFCKVNIYTFTKLHILLLLSRIFLPYPNTIFFFFFYFRYIIFIFFEPEPEQNKSKNIFLNLKPFFFSSFLNPNPFFCSFQSLD